MRRGRFQAGGATLKPNPHWNNVGKNEEDEGRLKDDLLGIQGDNSIDSGRFWGHL